MLVFTKGIAPASRSKETEEASSDKSWKHLVVNPSVLSVPLTLMLSLMEIGRPWRGPTGFPVVLRILSSSCALAIASG